MVLKRKLPFLVRASIFQNCRSVSDIYSTGIPIPVLVFYLLSRKIGSCHNDDL